MTLISSFSRVSEFFSLHTTALLSVGFVASIVILGAFLLLYIHKKQSNLSLAYLQNIQNLKENMVDRISELTTTMERRLGENLHQYTQQNTQDTAILQQVITQTLTRHTEEVSSRLKEINQHVELLLS